MKPRTYPFGYCPFCGDWHVGEWQDDGHDSYHDWRPVCSVCGTEFTEYQALEREECA
jgi:uncharacterized protein (DUF983 family)